VRVWVSGVMWGLYIFIWPRCPLHPHSPSPCQTNVGDYFDEESSRERFEEIKTDIKSIQFKKQIECKYDWKKILPRLLVFDFSKDNLFQDNSSYVNNQIASDNTWISSNTRRFIYFKQWININFQLILFNCELLIILPCIYRISDLCKIKEF
jgi:hypothetical protein